MRRINLKSLIRFEDTYGLADIFCARRKIPYLDISKISERLIEIDNDTFIDFGLGSGWGRISTDEAYSILERGIERIILVYDMDHLNGDKTKILEVQTLEKRIKDMKQLFKQLGYNIEILYIPVVYAAETLMLHQFYELFNGLQIIELVNLHNTWNMQLCILAYCIGEVELRNAKQCRNFLDIEKLLNRIKDIKEDDLNKNCKKWIVNGCNLNMDDLFNGTDAINHLKQVDDIFENLKVFGTDKYIMIGTEKRIRLDEEPQPLLKV